MEPTKEKGVGQVGTSGAEQGSVVKIDEVRIQAHLDEVVGSTVEETLKGL
jgi:hypothetical protein